MPHVYALASVCVCVTREKERKRRVGGVDSAATGLVHVLVQWDELGPVPKQHRSFVGRDLRPQLREEHVSHLLKVFDKHALADQQLLRGVANVGACGTK